MAKKSKQMRLSAIQYDLINEIAVKLGVNRAEVLSNAIVLVKFLMDNDATAIKAICKDGNTKELLMTILVGNWAK